MFCAHCGSKLQEAVLDCPSCGRKRPDSSPPPASQLGERLKGSSVDALTSLKTLLLDPVGGLSTAYSDLGRDRATAAGAVLCVGFALVASLGFTLGASRWLGSMLALTGNSGFTVFVKSFAALLVIPAGFVAAGLGVRKLLKSSEGVAADLFIAGMALAPLGIAFLLSGLLGAANVEVAMLLFLFAYTYLILMLYGGLTSVGHLNARAAAPAVPVVLLVAGWLTKIVFAALF